MAPFDVREHPHRRYNPLTREWILVSPHRTKRPWQGQVEKPAPVERPSYDPSCYLCPGNTRVGGARNPDYQGTFVFSNDFATLLPDTPDGALDGRGLLVAKAEKGICRVVCFSPNHSLTLPQMSRADLRRVIDVWVEQFADLGDRPSINYVQFFENKGAMMGCSNPHPHSQIWSSSSIPQIPAMEQSSQDSYLKENGACLLCDYMAIEVSSEERLICRNDHFVVLVPFWAVWPFEAMIVSCRHVSSIREFDGEERDALADIVKRLTTRFDNRFEVSFPYSMGLHQRPTDGQDHPEWHFHMHFYPPLLRSATVKKFMVGYEMLANPQRDLTAERAAQRLRELSETRFDAQ